MCIQPEATKQAACMAAQHKQNLALTHFSLSVYMLVTLHTSLRPLYVLQFVWFPIGLHSSDRFSKALPADFPKELPHPTRTHGNTRPWSGNWSLILMFRNFQNVVSLGATKVSADPEIRSSDPVKRSCYFDDEYALEAHEKYSQVSRWWLFEIQSMIFQLCYIFDIGCVHVRVLDFTHPVELDTEGKVPSLVLPCRGRGRANV